MYTLNAIGRYVIRSEYRVSRINLIYAERFNSGFNVLFWVRMSALYMLFSGYILLCTDVWWREARLTLVFLVYIHPASTEIYTQIFARHERALDRCERKEYIPEKRARPKFVFISNEAFCLVKYWCEHFAFRKYGQLRFTCMVVSSILVDSYKIAFGIKRELLKTLSK